MALLIIAILIFSIFLYKLFTRVKHLESENEIFKRDIKDLSHHILITNRDGVRESSIGGRWKEIPRPGSKGTFRAFIREKEEVSTEN